MNKIHKYLVLIVLIRFHAVTALVEFPQEKLNILKSSIDVLSQITEENCIKAIQLGSESVNRQESFENNLLQSNIFVTNGSVSHAQLLEVLPKENAESYNTIARKILKSSLYILNSECSKLNVDENVCANFISTISLPKSQLRQDCLKINKNLKPGYQAYRRLQPAYYKDGLQEMFKSSLPKPIEISKTISEDDPNLMSTKYMIDEKRNLILTQWTQFIEHDLSKSVVTTMKDGSNIECCNDDFFMLRPRHMHPSCAPLEGVITNSFKKISCLNYVRSAIALTSECRFGPAQQLNQGSSSLDLSQLYGISHSSQNEMREFKDGLLKMSSIRDSDMPYLPLAINKNKFCVTSVNSLETCFMAGDSRVNSNPFMIIIYTTFLRFHNMIARSLKIQNPHWNDDKLYLEAKEVNIVIYRRIVYEEWLPAVLGDEISKKILNEPYQNDNENNIRGVSSEFAVAAIRFYYSMMPSLLLDPQSYDGMLEEDLRNSKTPSSEIFSNNKEFYKSKLIFHTHRIDEALKAMISQRAMKMDANYAESFIENFRQTQSSFSKITGSDALALDIQRGRDHGVSQYVRYLEFCANTTINTWEDLGLYINQNDLPKIRRIYKSFENIDLVIGGLSEIPFEGSILGPTFTCILGEQFSTIRKNEKMANTSKNVYDVGNFKGSRLLCLTTSLMSVPQDIFYMPSEINRLLSCSDLRNENIVHIIDPAR